MPRPPLPRRIFIDFTQTYPSPYNTGIQRVVRKLVDILPAVTARCGVECYATVWRDGQFYIYDPKRVDNVTPRVADFKRDMTCRLPAGYRKSVERLCRAPGLKAVRSSLLPEAGHLGAYNVPVQAYVAVRKLLRDKPIEFRRGDCMLLSECYWGDMRVVWESAVRLKSQGLFLQSIIYDLIPLTHTHYFDEHTATNFNAYFQGLVRDSDVLTTISKTVQGQVHERLADVCPTAPRSRIASFRLGAEVSNRRGIVRDEVVAALAGGEKVHLMVSTIEPRKNHATVLEAFARLWDRGSRERLLLVGRVGWNVEPVMQRIRDLQAAGRPLSVFHDLSDVEVDYCYEHCGDVIYPSVTEGFGLPIVEALWHQKPTIASDTPIHREVGRDDCFYFETLDAESLIAAVQRAAASAASGHQRSRPHCTTWRESCEELFEVLKDAYARRDTASHEASPGKRQLASQAA